jgi:hypothetical protein
MSQNGGQNGPVVIPAGDMWAWKAIMGWSSQLGKSDSSIRALWQSYQQIHMGASRRNGRGSENFAYHYLRYYKGSLRCRKSYDVGPQALLPIRRKVCGRFLSPLKIRYLGRVWTVNPRHLGQVASTLTTTPPRRHIFTYVKTYLFHFFIVFFTSASDHRRHMTIPYALYFFKWKWSLSWMVL